MLSLLCFWRMGHFTQDWDYQIWNVLILLESVVPSKCWQLGDSEMCHAGCFDLFAASPGKRGCAVHCLCFSWKKFLPSAHLSTLHNLTGRQSFPLPPPGSAPWSLGTPSSTTFAEGFWSPYFPFCAAQHVQKWVWIQGRKERKKLDREP